MIWFEAVVAKERRNVGKSMVHRRQADVVRMVAALSQLYIKASSPKEPPGPYSITFSPSTKAYGTHKRDRGGGGGGEHSNRECQAVNML